MHPTQVYQVFGKWYYVTCKICKYFSCTLCALMGLLTWWLQWLHNFKLSFCINWGLEFKEEQTTASFIPTLLQNLTLVIIIFPGLKQIVFLLEERVLTSQGVWILCQAQQQNPIVKLALLKFHALLHTNYGSWQFMTPPPSSHFGSWNVLVTNPICDGCDLGPTIHLSLFHPLNALSLNP